VTLDDAVLDEVAAVLEEADAGQGPMRADN